MNNLVGAPPTKELVVIHFSKVIQFCAVFVFLLTEQLPRASKKWVDKLLHTSIYGNTFMDINNTSITIEQLAYKIKKLKLETPALLFLEMHKPLTSLLHHGTVFFAPLVAPLFGLKRYSKIQTLLADRNNIEQLIKKLTT